MQRTLVSVFAAMALLGGTAVAVSGQPMGVREVSDQAVLTVRADRPGVKINPLLYGVFFEEINHAGDGGLYAELLRNRSLEDAATAASWSLVSREGGKGALALDTAEPLNNATPHSLRLTRESGKGEVGAANGGYWGVPVQKGERYRLSLFARGEKGFKGRLTARLESADGKVYATSRLDRPSTEWKRFTTELKSDATDPAARLVISMADAGSVWLDVVSLFPKETWNNRPNGLRPDLAELVAGLKPAYVRFPGGCYCEGDKLANAFRWKESLGPIEERPGHWNLWGYRSTDGLGYHEYLQWCEDLGAEPLFVVNCGMSHTDHVPLEQLDPWVQDALDAVEYANGPVTSKWGALRAKNGHPKPFNLKLLEIGNENGWGNTLAAYEARYARFYDALKQRYPQLTLIANVPVRNRPVDLVDDHYYNSPDWFAANVGLYDRYDRARPKVYVGEYAVTQNAGEGNLQAALGEAAFMTGLERNADVIKMASYAPLFVNVKDRKWNPDAIVFDTHRSYGTPSYYVQKLFAEHRGDVTVPTDLLAPRSQGVALPGQIGLATWRTQAEFRDVRVTSGDRTLFASDFGKGTEGWKVGKGQWEARDGVLRQTSEGEDLRVNAGDPTWTDYTLRLRARKISGAEGFLIMFRARNDGDFYWWNLGGWNNTLHAIEKAENGLKHNVGEALPGKIETGRWYDLRIELKGPQIACYLNDKLVQVVEDRPPSPLHAVATRSEKTGDLILKLVNVGGNSQPVDLRLQGMAGVRSTGTAHILTGKPLDENSLDQPRRIVPREETLTGIGSQFSRTLPPHSLTILRLKS